MQYTLKQIATGAALIVATTAGGCQNASTPKYAMAVTENTSAAVRFDVAMRKPVLRPVRFSFRVHCGGSGALLPAGLDSQLQPLLERFDSWDQITRVVVVGHTDAEGSEKSNLLLSIRRANALADKLIDYGVPEGAVEVDGRGEQAPIADNNSISGKKINRRVEIIAEGLAELGEIPRLGLQSAPPSPRIKPN